MRIVIIGIAALGAVARAALAGSILYATAATTGEIDGFCLGSDGSIASTPKVHVATAGTLPRRLVVGRDASGRQTLYVAEADRIEAFPIGKGGALQDSTATKPVAALDPRDLALAPDGRTVYATHHGYITAYQLGVDINGDGKIDPNDPAEATGALPKEPTSCVQGAAGTNYLDLQLTNGLLYATADDAPGRVEVYGLNCDGSLPESVPDGTAMGPETPCDQPGTSGRSIQAGTDCGPVPNDKKKASKFPYSERARIQKPKALVVTGDTVYVEERAVRKIIAFRLQPDGTFCDRKKQRTGLATGQKKPDRALEDCTGFVQLGKPNCDKLQAKIDSDVATGTMLVRFPARHPQCAASKTASVLQYEGLVLDPVNGVLIGAQFFKGRVDSYRLRPEPRLAGSPVVKLPKQPTATSTQDPRMTPVRLTVNPDGKTVYVAAGELDRVIAYRLTGAGVLAAKEPFSRTAEQKDSFPNDVAVAMLSAACE